MNVKSNKFKDIIYNIVNMRLGRQTARCTMKSQWSRYRLDLRKKEGNISDQFWYSIRICRDDLVLVWRVFSICILRWTSSYYDCRSICMPSDFSRGVYMCACVLYFIRTRVLRRFIALSCVIDTRFYSQRQMPVAFPHVRAAVIILEIIIRDKDINWGGSMWPTMILLQIFVWSSQHYRTFPKLLL